MANFFLCIFALTANSFKLSKDVKSLVDEYFLPEDSVKAKLVFGSWEIVYKDLMPQNANLFSGEKTFAIKKCSHHPWGVTTSRSTEKPLFEIKNIYPGKQFEELGITIGWKITKINDVPLSETNAKEFQDLYMQGDACTLTFKSDDYQFTLLQHQKSKRLLLKSLQNEDTYADYITNVQLYLEQKQWIKAYAPWHFIPNIKRRIMMKLPRNLHKILQHNLVDFINVNGQMHQESHDTPLCDAITERDHILAKKLIFRGAKVNANSMRAAIFRGSVKCTQLLLDVNPNVVYSRDCYDNIPLFVAITLQSTISIKRQSTIKCGSLLLKYGANLKTRDRDGRTALQLAKFYENEEYVKILTLAELVQKSIKKECLQKFRQNK